MNKIIIKILKLLFDALKLVKAVKYSIPFKELIDLFDTFKLVIDKTSS